MEMHEIVFYLWGCFGLLLVAGRKYGSQLWQNLSKKIKIENDFFLMSQMNVNESNECE
jgi:hypothetical protein